VNRRHLVLAGALGVVGPSCTEQLTGPGSCPDYCPVTAPLFADTLIFPVTVGLDSSYRGYVRAEETTRLQIVEQGATVSSRALFEFAPLPDSVRLGGDTTLRPVIRIDSARLQFALVTRDISTNDLALGVYQLPPGLDSTTTYDDVAPSFELGRLVTTMIVDSIIPPDSTTGERPASGTLEIIVPGSAFTIAPEDSGIVALGIDAAASSGVPFAVLGAAEALTPAITSYFVAVDSAGDPTSTAVAPALQFDTFVFTPAFGAPVGLEVGGVPSARSILRFDFPEGVVDTSRVSRATLLLVPLEPVAGVPGESMTVVANAVAADFGAKSPLVPDSAFRATVSVAAGDVDTIRIDLTTVLRAWGGTPDLPRAVMLRATPEAGALTTVRFGTTVSLSFQPAMRVAFFRPYPFGER
jgi:hypothetical protein